MNALNVYRWVCDVWKSLGLDANLRNCVAPDDDLIKAKLENKYPAVAVSEPSNEAPRRDLRPESSSYYFDQQEESLLCECVAAFARTGFPLQKANLKDWADAFLEADTIDTGMIATGGISSDTVDRIYKHGKMKAQINVNSIDPKRAGQADPQALNPFYHQLDAWVKVAHEIDPVAWPEDRYANIPAHRIYNTDEQGPNPTSLRNAVLIPRDMIESLDRLFQNTREGDGKMTFHYSVANIVRADGVQCHPELSVEGAPAPYILISDSSSTTNLDSMDKAERDRLLANQKETDLIRLNDAVLEGWYDDFEPGKKDDIVNPFGFQIRTTPTGSMLKRTFYDFMLHFSKQLPHTQGRNGEGVFLFLDWHCSRECPQSLITTFFKHNILLFVLAAKTSIWAQPCDNGKNELTAKDISFAAHNHGLMVGKPMDYRDANRVFREGLKKNCIQQNEELRRTESNAVVSSFKKTGLYPMNYNNDGWQNVIQSFYKLNQLITQQKVEAGEILPTIIWVAKPKLVSNREVLTDDEDEALRSFLSSDDFLRGDTNEEGGRDAIELPLIVLAMAIAEQLIGKYIIDEERDISMPPIPTEPFETAALKLVYFDAVTPENKVDTSCTLSAEQVAREKLVTKLSAAPFGESIVLRRKDHPTKKLHLMKQNPKIFVVIDNERRYSRNQQAMSFSDVLDQCLDAKDDETYTSTLTKKDRQKSQTKARMARKRLNESLYEEARNRANSNRIKKNIETMNSRLATRRPQFAARLATLLEEEEMEMDDLYNNFEEVVLEPHSEAVSVTRGDTTKDFDVTVVGSDVSAVSHKAETTLMKLMVELKAAGRKNGERAKRKRCRGPGQSTRLGKSGASVGILIQRQNKKDELKLLEKEEKGLLDEVEKLKSLLEKVHSLQKELPKTYWKWEAVKGWKREVLARLCDVFKSGLKADDLANALKALGLTKRSVDEKVINLKNTISEKATMIQPIIAKRREREDFLDCTREHGEDDNNDGPGSDVDDE